VFVFVVQAVFEAFVQECHFFVGERNVGFVNHSGIKPAVGSWFVGL
jgi:hypothetical protein